MTTTSDTPVTPGSGKNVACFEITEDAKQKQLQRVASCDSAGNEIEAITVGQGTMAQSLPVVIASDQSTFPVTASLAAAQTLATVTTVGTVTTITNVVHVDDNASTISIDDGAGSITVDGTVTANAGTNLNTSLLALEAGGNLATLVTNLGAVTASPTTNTIADRLKTLHTDSANFTAGNYETVAASQTDQAMGATGGAGDYLEAVLIIPGTAAAGAVSIKDGAGSAISIFAGGGTTALADLAPIYVPLGVISGSGAWKITTGTNVTSIGIGKFT